MSTNRLEVTGNVGLDKNGMRPSSAHDLNELSDEELKGVAGGQLSQQLLRQFYYNRISQPNSPYASWTSQARWMEAGALAAVARIG